MPRRGPNFARFLVIFRRATKNVGHASANASFDANGDDCHRGHHRLDRPGQRSPARVRRSPPRRDGQPRPDSEIAAPSLALRRCLLQHGADGVRQELRPQARRLRARGSRANHLQLACRIQLFPAGDGRRQGRGDEAAGPADGELRERPADRAVRIRAEVAAQAQRQDRFRRLRPDLLHGDRLHRGRPHGGRQHAGRLCAAGDPSRPRRRHRAEPEHADRGLLQRSDRHRPQQDLRDQARAHCNAKG